MSARPLLAIDTATRRTTVAVGDGAGSAHVAADDRHGRPLLELLDTALADAGATRDDLGGVVVGTGPGSFTGLRVGMATAKTLAYVLGLPVAAVPSVEALAAAALRRDGGDRAAVLLPAGARDHYLALVERADAPGGVRLAEPVRLLAPGVDAFAEVGTAVPVAVDVADDAAPAEAIARGREAVEGLGDALLRLGAARLAAGATAAVETLVPEYVAVPRGVSVAASEVAWSPDLR